MSKSWLKLSVFLAAIFLMLSVYSWRAKICFNPDELFYYKSTQTISDFKSLCAPEYYGEHRFQKPPLFYLAVFLSFKLFGVNWFSARLVAMISSILVLIMSYLLGRKMFDKEKAFWATGILATTILFFRFGRIALPEMSFIFFIITAFYFAYCAFLENKQKFFYLSFLSMGIGTLIKGPISFLLPASVILIFYLTNKKRNLTVRIPWIRGFFMVLLLSSLWFIPAFLIYGKEFLNHIMTVEVIYRLSDKIQLYGVWDHVWHYLKKFTFYIPITLAQYLPWSVLGLAALVILHKKLERGLYSVQRKFLLIWFLSGYLIITFISARRAHYVLLLLPALSLYFISFFDFKYEYIKKLFQKFLMVSIAGYFFTIAIVFPYIFSDGVDRLSVKLKNELAKNNAPVVISWRLDPQEVELYIDRSGHLVNDWVFSEREGAYTKIPQIIAKSQKDKPFFYILLAEEEYDQYFNIFFSYVEEYVGDPIAWFELCRDWRWGKTMKFNDFFRKTIKTPKMVKHYFKDAFQEEVFLIVVGAASGGEQ